MIEQVTLTATSAGDRQSAQVEKFQRMENKDDPGDVRFPRRRAMPARIEAREKLRAVRPTNLGQASRISGLCPADLAVVMMYSRADSGP